MESIELAVLLAPPRKIPHLNNESPLWYGRVLTESQLTARVYFKKVNPAQMFSEVICAITGRALGLPIPRPYIIRDTAGFMGAPDLLLFAMEDAGHPSMRQWVSKIDEDEVIQALLAWKQIRDAALFDEWIANKDRNQGNLLYDGNSEFVLIDHGYAFGGPGWDTGRLDPALETRNVLVELLKAVLGDVEIARLRRIAGERTPDYRGIAVPALKERALPDFYGMGAKADAVLSFLQGRIGHIPSLVSRHGAQRTLI